MGKTGEGLKFAYVDRDGSEYCVYSGDGYQFLLGSADSEVTAKYLCDQANAAHAESVKGLVEERDALARRLARAEVLHFKMCRASLDAEGMAVSERAIKEVWRLGVEEEPK